MNKQESEFFKNKPLIIKDGEAFLSLDNNWKCIYINEWAKNILQKKQGECLGINFFNIIPETLNSITKDKLIKNRIKQQSLVLELFISTTNIWLQVSFIPHLNGIDIFLKDITLSKKQQSEKDKNEKKFANAFESSAMALLIVNYENEIIIDVNKSFLNLFEFSKHEVIERTFSSLNIIPKQKDKSDFSICGELEINSIYKYDVNALTKTKKIVNIILSSEVIATNGEKKLLLTFIDITEKFKFQKLIAESEVWFRSIADNSPVLIWGTDELMECNYINKTWSDFTGIKNTKFDWQEIIHENDLKEFLQTNERAYHLRKSFKREFRLKNKYGNFKWMYEFSNPIFLPDGTFKGFIGSCADIDDKKNEKINLEQLVQQRTLELNTALEKEKNLNDAKSRFVSLASHEFRTPLSSILSSVYLIEKYSSILDEKISNNEIDIDTKLLLQRQKHLDRIKKSINHLTETLTDFLSIDQLEQNKVSIKFELFDLNLFSIEMIDEVKNILKKNQQIFYSFNGLFNINQDKKILKNIYMNLLSNASKYSFEGSPIFLKIETDAKNVFIEFKDSGIGIPHNEQDSIFNKFFRAENTTAIQGTGLGLNIVKKYVELLNGSINFQSRQDKGTSFILSFPRNIN